MEIRLRTIALEDTTTVHRLSGQLGYDLAVEQTREQIAAVLQRNDHCAFVALLNDNVVGWIHAFIAITIESKPFVEIGGIVIDENYRNKGIGETLVNKIKEWALERSIPSLRVRSNVKRQAAHRFYFKAGFKEIKEQKVFALEL